MKNFENSRSKATKLAPCDTLRFKSSSVAQKKSDLEKYKHKMDELNVKREIDRGSFGLVDCTLGY